MGKGGGGGCMADAYVCLHVSEYGGGWCLTVGVCVCMCL